MDLSVYFGAFSQYLVRVRTCTERRHGDILEDLEEDACTQAVRRVSFPSSLGPHGRKTKCKFRLLVVTLNTDAAMFTATTGSKFQVELCGATLVKVILHGAAGKLLLLATW